MPVRSAVVIAGGYKQREKPRCDTEASEEVSW